MSGGSGDITKAIVNPFSTAAKVVGIDLGSNDLLKAADYLNPLKTQTELAKGSASLLKANEVSGAITELDGTKDTLLDQAEKARKKMEKNVASDKAALADLNNQGNLLSSGSNVLNPARAKTGAGKQELERLLTIFEARQSEISARRARPGAGQTRLV
jgi:hypothetical protein